MSGAPAEGGGLSALPDELAAALDAEVRSADARAIQRRAAALLERLRAPRQGGLAREKVDTQGALAHAALLLPATHARLLATLASAAGRTSWSPRTLLDLGSGAGAALWAAATVWPSLVSAVAVEREPALVALGRRLASASSSPLVSQARWLEANLLGGLPSGPHDVVILGHVLGELEPSERGRVVAEAWAACSGVLAVVEAGTPAGFECVRSARDVLLSLGGRTLSPCPHDAPCPLVDDWCHFVVRAARPEVQRRVKSASLPWEDAKHSHAVVARFDVARPWARVLRHPQRSKGRVELSLCTAEGLVARSVTKRSGPDRWRAARRARWGDALED